MTNLLNKM